MGDTDRLKGRPATLDRWPGERRDRHRALLLWAMQGPMDRSNRAVARALGVSDGSVRNWRRSSCWDARLEAHGDDGDQDALDRYRAEYMADFGRLEMPHVAGNVVRPLGAVDLRDPAAQASHQARQRVAQALPAAQAEAEQATAQAVADHRRDTRQDADRHIKLVDASLGLIARKLRADEVRVGVRDIPVLLDCRERLVAVVNGTHHDGARGALVESARVKHARETGGDVVAAMHEDAQELVAILGALRATDQVDLHALAQADQAARDAVAQDA
jgi:hypothetical protein